MFNDKFTFAKGDPSIGPLGTQRVNIDSPPLARGKPLNIPPLVKGAPR